MRCEIALLLVVVLFACSVAQAEVYQWIDGKGVVHFTDNPDKVPAAYRHKVKVLSPSDRMEGQKPPAPEQPPAATPSPPSQTVELYGGHNEQWWRTSLETARAEVLAARQQLAAKKDSLTALHRKRVVYQKPSDRIAYKALAEEISRDEETIKGLEESLSKLEAEAEKLRVPMEWRK